MAHGDTRNATKSGMSAKHGRYPNWRREQSDMRLLTRGEAERQRNPPTMASHAFRKLSFGGTALRQYSRNYDSLHHTRRILTVRCSCPRVKGKGRPGCNHYLGAVARSLSAPRRQVRPTMYHSRLLSSV
jgi:hypothetical protein